MELCDCSTRDIFEYEEDPLLEEEIAAIAEGSLKVSFLHFRNSPFPGLLKNIL